MCRHTGTRFSSRDPSGTVTSTTVPRAGWGSTKTRHPGLTRFFWISSTLRRTHSTSTEPTKSTSTQTSCLWNSNMRKATLPCGLLPALTSPLSGSYTSPSTEPEAMSTLPCPAAGLPTKLPGTLSFCTGKEGDAPAKVKASEKNMIKGAPRQVLDQKALMADSKYRSKKDLAKASRCSASLESQSQSRSWIQRRRATPVICAWGKQGALAMRFVTLKPPERSYRHNQRTLPYGTMRMHVTPCQRAKW